MRTTSRGAAPVELFGKSPAEIDHVFGAIISRIVENDIGFGATVYEARERWSKSPAVLAEFQRQPGKRVYPSAFRRSDGRRRRFTEEGTGAAGSVFHFDAPGSFAKSVPARCSMVPVPSYGGPPSCHCASDGLSPCRCAEKKCGYFSAWAKTVVSQAGGER